MDSRGFIHRWLVLEPIQVNGLLTQSAVETRDYNLNLYHFAWSLSKATSNVLFRITTVVESPAEMHDVRLAIGSNAASLWWLNDTRVIAIYGDRQTVIDDGVSRRLILHKGRNVLRAAIVNGREAIEQELRKAGTAGSANPAWERPLRGAPSSLRSERV